MTPRRWAAALAVVVGFLGACAADNGVTVTAARRAGGPPPTISLPAAPATAPLPTEPSPAPTTTTTTTAPVAEVVETTPLPVTEPVGVDPAPSLEPAVETPPPPPEPPKIVPIPAVAPGDTTAAFAAFDRVIEQATIGAGAQTLGIALAYNGQIVHESAYGIEDPRSGSSPSATSRFRIASISKVFTAVAVMQLVDQGVISLDEVPLGEFGQPFGDPRMATITVRQLLSHTSGLPQSEPVFFRGQVSSWQEAGAAVLAGPLDFEPGTSFRYSNANYALLGSLIELRTGVPYEQAIVERVLNPLGIAGMRLAGTFDANSGEVYHPSTAGRNYMESLGPAGQWIAAPADVLRLVTAINNGQIVSPQSSALMRTPVPPVAPPVAPGFLPWNYGLGLRLWSDGSWGHTGTVEHGKGIVLVRTDGWSVAILDNGDVPRKTDEFVRLIQSALEAM
jgi:D-alanyl-D-alanine carboxypeptidase